MNEKIRFLMGIVYAGTERMRELASGERVGFPGGEFRTYFKSSIFFVALYAPARIV